MTKTYSINHLCLCSKDITAASTRNRWWEETQEY